MLLVGEFVRITISIIAEYDVCIKLFQIFQTVHNGYLPYDWKFKTFTFASIELCGIV